MPQRWLQPRCDPRYPMGQEDGVRGVEDQVWGEEGCLPRLSLPSRELRLPFEDSVSDARSLVSDGHLTISWGYSKVK